MASSDRDKLKLLLAFVLLQYCLAQQDFSEAPIPNPFRVGNFYPPRAEIEVCRAIQDRIERGTARFNSQLVTNTNPDISFATDDSRIMSSRLQSRLNNLVNIYNYNSNGNRNSNPRIVVEKAWTPFEDPDLINDPQSLHYEGRTVRVRLQSGVSSSQYNSLLTAAIDAQFDWVFYATSGYIRLSVIPSSCDRNIDMVFILDQSGSVGRTNHEIAKQFISNVVSFFSIGLDQTRVGLVTFSRNSQIEFNLDRHTSLSSLTAAIRDIPYRGGRTVTALALDDARRVLDPSQGLGARPISEGIPRIAILITDGRSNTFSIIDPANNLKSSGVQVYTIGVSNYDLGELRFISSDPDSEHVFLLGSFRDAIAFVDFLSVTTCESQAIIGTCETTSSMVPQDTLQYFQADCNSFHTSVLVELTDVSGSSFLYCSSVASNPGPLTDNTESNQMIGVSTRECRLSISSEETIYVGVLGQELVNSVNLIVMDDIFTQRQLVAAVVEGEMYSLNLRSLLRSEVPQSIWTYRIIDGNDGNVFEIVNSGTFRIRSSQLSSIDSNTRPQYNVLVMAERSSASCSCSQLRLQLNIISNRIDFVVSPSSPMVPEDAGIGHDVTTISATSGAGIISFRISEGNIGNAFLINSDSGLVEVASALDFETTSVYTLTVRADVDGTSVTDTTTVTVSVTDVNEPPSFLTECAQQGNCLYSMDENSPSGTMIATISATDPDLPTVSNGMLIYSISDTSLPFMINSDGIITTTEILDHERAASYSFRISVMDSSVTISTAVVVTVNDLNDNPPVITGPTVISVDENIGVGFVLTQYTATDPDSGNNAAIVFSLTTNGVPFDIDSMDGSLTVTGTVDFETVEQFSIMVTATNPGSTQSDSITTLIDVNNLNDNRPTFNGAFSGSVMENSAVNTSVVTVTASDNDRGQPGEVRYSIVGGNFGNSFQIDPVSGQVTVASNIDREIMTTFELRVRAVDLGNPEQRRTTRIPITVTDVNDNSPVFNPESYLVEVREDANVGTEVLTVFAFDDDEPGNPNSQIVYSISDGNIANAFGINGTTGVLQLTGDIDFETLPSYTLTIVAMDQGTPQLQDTAVANISLININDVPPSVNGSVRISLSESTPVNTQVLDYDATDADQSAITFNFMSGNEEGRFSIASDSGRITLVRSLDFETTQQYVIQVIVSDGQLETSSMLTIDILDENDFAPFFNGSTTFKVDEESPSNTLIGTINALDNDGSSPNNQVSYAFAQQSPITDHITLDTSSGEIRTNGVLDREQLTQIFNPPSSTQTVNIVARDGGSPSQQSSVTISITLRDINDNAPVFGDPSYANSLLENLPALQNVFQLTATDADLGANAQIQFSYTLVDNSINPFQIDPMSGLVQTNQSLDCEMRGSYTFMLTAQDMGMPSLNNTVLGNLIVVDENDNSPIFTMEPYIFSVGEDVAQEALLARVEANDADKGLNGQIEYSVINQAISVFSGEDAGNSVAPLVRINSTSGELFQDSNSQIDYERQTQFNVTVIARDSGVPRRSTSAQVIFNVMNIDESGPVFPSQCEFDVPENAPLNQVIVECLATDTDNIATSPNTVLVTYNISVGNDDGIFAIDPNTGGISLLRPLDRETATSHSFFVRAEDLSGLVSFQTVVITVTDINDNAPMFTSNTFSYAFSVSRIQSQTQDLIMLSAIDRDEGENAVITYSITNVARTSSQTTLDITAQDGGTPANNLTVQLVITFDQLCLLQEYSIDPSSGQVSASVLCSVSIRPPALNITLGGSNTFTCEVLSNNDLDYQWIHNGSFITTQTRTDALQFSYTVIEAQYSDQGGFACKVSTSAGSIQSVTSSANIQIAPIITVPPVNQGAREGDAVNFTCKAVGVPEPRIEWFRNSVKIHDGEVLMIEKVDSTNTGTYTCTAINSNVGNPAVMSATLSLYRSNNVVELGLERISNPNEDGTCHYIDYRGIETIIDRLTRQRTVTISVEGPNICPVSPCMPNPCQNRGSCLLNDRSLGGYQCECADGYTGRNCDQDAQECAESPCENGGTCSELLGSFQCDCLNGIHGHRCQYMNTCANSSLCNQGMQCVDSSAGQAVCIPQPTQGNSLLIRVDGIDPGFLSDRIQTYLERMAASSTRRTKRQLVLVTGCEAQFVAAQHISVDTFALVWLCVNETQPTIDQQATLCSVLLQSGYVLTCSLPGRMPIAPSTPAPLPDTSATVNIILVRPRTSNPFSSRVIVDELVNTGAMRALTSSINAEVGSITVPEGGMANNGGTVTNDPSGVNAGIAVGALLALCVIVFLIVLVVVMAIKYRDHKRRQQEKQTNAIQKAISLHSLDLDRQDAERAQVSSSTEFLVDEPQTANVYDIPRSSKGQSTNHNQQQLSGSTACLIDGDERSGSGSPDKDPPQTSAEEHTKL